MNLASQLRALAARGQYGHSRTPDNFYMGESYCTYYHSHAGSLVEDHAQWVRIARLSARYRRYVQFCREVLPQWVEVSQIHWADNSIDSVQRDKDGNERRVMISAPIGDACF